MSHDKRRRLFRLPFRKDAVELEVDDELAFHLEERTAKYVREGMSAKDARTEAERRFGDVAMVKEEVERMMRRRQRAMNQSDFFDDVRHDIAYAGRQVLRSPTFSGITILTIALAIGATTAVFSVVDGILLRPLPFRDADELVMVWADYTRRDVVLPDKRREWLSWPNFSDFRSEVSAVESVSAFFGWGPTLTEAGPAQRIDGAMFSHGMFSRVLDVEPALGRAFLPSDDVPGSQPSVLISDGFWHRAFGGDPDIVGQTIRLSEEPYTVIGVMPADFQPPPFLGTEIWSMMQFDASNGGGRGSAFIRSVGRLEDSASLDLAREQATQLGTRLEQEYPESNVDTGFNVYPLQFDIVQEARMALWLLFGAVSFVLLIACVNVANLLLARGAARRSELAVRVALGAGRRRVLTQLMTESLMLAGIGGGLGVALSLLGTRGLVLLAPAGTPLLEQVAVDGRILGFAAIATMLTGVLFGLLPALRAARVQPSESLREDGRSGGAPSTRLRNSLVVGQIALALVLLVGAGLLVRSFQNLQRVDLGFEPENVLSMRIQLPGVRYDDASSRTAFFTGLEQRLASIPGVASVGSITNLPLAGQDGDTNFFVEGEPLPQAGLEPSVWFRRVTPDYFGAMGLRIVSGRSFTPSDDAEATRVVMVNETLERDYFGGQAVGKRLSVGDPENPSWWEVVGVVQDIKNFGIRSSSRNALYLPFAQVPTTGMYTVLRTTVEPETLVGPIRAEAAEMDVSVALASIQPMEELVSTSLATDRFTTSLLGGFAMVALFLAVVGLYGVVTYSVTIRQREMGVRIALGAQDTGIRKLVLGWALSLAAAGVVIGTAGALGMTRLMEGLLFGVQAADGLTFVLVSGLMTVAAALASLIPAHRATRVDPIKVLKAD